MSPLRRAFDRILTRPSLMVGVAVIQVVAGALVTLSSTAALSTLMDRRPAAAAMLRGDDGLLLELLQRHQEVAAVWATAALLALAVAVLLGWTLAGTLLSALAFDEVRGAAQLARATIETLSCMIKVSLLGLVLRALPLGLGALAWSWLRPELQGTFPSVLAAAAGCVAAFAVPWAVVTVTIDYARAIVLGDSKGRAVPALKRALRLAWTQRLQTVTLALASSALFVLTLLIGQGLQSLTAPWALAHFLAAVIAVSLRVGVTAFGLVAAATIVNWRSP